MLEETEGVADRKGYTEEEVNWYLMPTLMHLPPGWYAIAESREIPKGKLVALERFATNLLLWRSSEQLVIMDDRCPHRSARLSLGKLRNGAVTCPFHGFEFSDSGACTFVPETKNPAPNLSVQTYRVNEHDGMVFVRVGEHSGEYPPWFDEISDDFAHSTLTSVWACHITRCIENQLDYAHLPFLHGSTIGGGVDPSLSAEFELSEEGIKVYTNRANKKTFFQFKFPNIWLLSIIPDRLLLLLAFAPIDDKRTKLYLRTYQRFCTFPLLNNILGWIMNWQNKLVLKQDEKVVLSQSPSSSMRADDERLYPSDQGIAFFRKQWKARMQKDNDAGVGESQLCRLCDS